MIRGKNILLVDDQVAVRAAFSLMLGLDGHQVTEASDGLEALALFNQKEFDLVITDFLMPNMRGDELAIRLKEMAPSTPIVMITAHEQHLGDRENPVDCILSKPFRLEELRGAIAAVTRLSAHTPPLCPRS